jgi:hypothetical protein
MAEIEGHSLTQNPKYVRMFLKYNSLEQFYYLRQCCIDVFQVQKVSSFDKNFYLYSVPMKAHVKPSSGHFGFHIKTINVHVYSYNNFQQIVVRIAANLILTTNDITESIQ